jgi:hypothetical protein
MEITVLPQARSIGFDLNPKSADLADEAAFIVIVQLSHGGRDAEISWHDGFEDGRDIKKARVTVSFDDPEEFTEARAFCVKNFSRSEGRIERRFVRSLANAGSEQVKELLGKLKVTPRREGRRGKFTSEG